MYFLLGISLTLAFLLIVNMIVAVFASGLWRMISGRVARYSANARAQIIFGLRILPVAAALVFVSAFLIPAYLVHEPEASGEVVSLKLAVIAAAATLGVLIALYRVFQTWRATRLLASNWLQNADEIILPGVNARVHRIEHQFPVIAVIGIFRPKMFIASQVLASLDEAELSAAVAHEYGHLRSRDNLKRTALRVCRDLLIFPFGKALDAAWADNAESLADEFAAKNKRSSALDLASALVKIARIVPAHISPSMPAGAFLIDEHLGDVTGRVRHLVSLSDGQAAAEGADVLGVSPAVLLWLAALAVLLILPLIDKNLLWSTHEAVEQFVSVLR